MNSPIKYHITSMKEGFVFIFNISPLSHCTHCSLLCKDRVSSFGHNLSKLYRFKPCSHLFCCCWGYFRSEKKKRKKKAVKSFSSSRPQSSFHALMLLMCGSLSADYTVELRLVPKKKKSEEPTQFSCITSQ